MKQILLSRNLYHQIKAMNKAELDNALKNIYEKGKEEAMKGIEVIDVDMDKMRSQIGAIKGIGETMLNQIMNIIIESLKHTPNE